MLVDPLVRRLALEKLMLGNMTIEWSADRQRRQTFGKGQERELHPDNLLKRKKTGPFFEHWQKGLALGQEHWLPGRVLPYNRLMGMCRWMGSHFYDWIDYNGVAFSRALLEWGRTFSDFWRNTVLHISNWQTYRNVCTVGVFHSI